jgi:hypothetical protein
MILIAILIKEKQKQTDNPRMFVATFIKIFSCTTHETKTGSEVKLHGGKKESCETSVQS